jgi:hypothetical protein
MPPRGDAGEPIRWRKFLVPQSLIRFACSCGKRLAAPAKSIGRGGVCPRCGAKVSVPATSTIAERQPASGPAKKAGTKKTAAKTAAAKPLPRTKSAALGKLPPLRKRAAAPPEAAGNQQPCAHPRLEAFYRALLKQFQPLIAQHEVANGMPTVRLALPEDRRQAIRLHVEPDDRGREWLVIDSEIGTLTTFEEAATALKLNHALGAARLYLDKHQVLQLEYRARLDETAEADVLQAVEHVARWADEFEAELFGIDVR